MNKERGLVWSPIHEFVSEQIAAKQKLRLLISPFVRLNALAALVDLCEDVSELQVIARWTGADILSGIADLDIYPYLKEKRIPLYLHPSIHLKLVTVQVHWGL